MSQTLGVFGLPDFAILQPVFAWRAFLKYEKFISLILQIFLSSVIRGH
jgi:hypothetical protein